jgi:hypothetical protein
MPDYICLSRVYPKYIPYIRDLNRIIRGYPWDIPDYVCLSLVYPYTYFFLTKNFVDWEVGAADPEKARQRQYHKPWSQFAVCPAQIP